MSYFLSSSSASRHDLFPGAQITTATGETLTLSLVELEPHSEVPWHSHPHEQLGILLEGAITFWAGDEEQQLCPGDMWRIPGGVSHRVLAGDEPVKALDVFHPVREDYR